MTSRRLMIGGQNDGQWVESNQEVFDVPLKRPVSLSTAWVDPRSQISERECVYGREKYRAKIVSHNGRSSVVYVLEGLAFKEGCDRFIWNYGFANVERSEYGPLLDRLWKTGRIEYRDVVQLLCKGLDIVEKIQDLAVYHNSNLGVLVRPTRCRVRKAMYRGDISYGTYRRVLAWWHECLTSRELLDIRFAYFAKPLTQRTYGVPCFRDLLALHQ